MRKSFVLIICVTLWSTMFAQEKFSVVLKGQIFNTQNEVLSLQQNDGSVVKTLAQIPLDKKGFFSQKVELRDKDYYTLTLKDNQSITIIIRTNDTLKIYGDGKNFFQFTNVIGSPETVALLDFLRIQAVYNRKLDSANQYLQQNLSQQKQIQQDFSPVYQNYVGQRQQFIRSNNYSPALIGAISNLNLDGEWSTYEQIINELKGCFSESPTVQRLVKEFENNKQIMMARTPLMPGNQAKEIALPNPQGDTLRLSDYKGKIVLIDFWASWCGPCRRENPNVVKLYQQYKDKGFEIFSVSLDKSRDAWIGAIQQDGLVWKGHVSDLAYWQSIAAKAYNVNSIPTTVLIDKDGKIIASNLRGEALAQKLHELLD
ncbi:MAG: TlpA family protein disulfide reductase [Brumimicrobium sp.]|nr:TlpA family protein disulfide reductase [Brumimicrobium sp.]